MLGSWTGHCHVIIHVSTSLLTELTIGRATDGGHLWWTPVFLLETTVTFLNTHPCELFTLMH